MEETILKMPKITIITPSYNQGQYLEQTIRSVLGQQYSNLEYIIMDGGSTDNSVEIIKRYTDKLAYWQSNPDGGQAAAIAKGFEMATGDILGWLNSDDVFLPGCLQTVASKFPDDPETVALTGRIALICTQGKPVGVFLPQKRHWKHMTLCGHGLAQMATFWRRSTYEMVGGLDTSMTFAFDFDLFVRLKKLGNICLIHDYLAGFRQHPSQKTATLQEISRTERQLIRQKYGSFSSCAWLFKIGHKFRPIQRITERFAWIRDSKALEQVCVKWKDICTVQKTSKLPR